MKTKLPEIETNVPPPEEKKKDFYGLSRMKVKNFIFVPGITLKTARANITAFKSHNDAMLWNFLTRAMEYNVKGKAGKQPGVGIWRLDDVVPKQPDPYAGGENSTLKLLNKKNAENNQ